MYECTSEYMGIIDRVWWEMDGMLEEESWYDYDGGTKEEVEVAE